MQGAAPAPRLEENWFDEAFVSDWIKREDRRAALRMRHFAMLRALLPFKHDAEFFYLNVGAGPGALDDLILARYPNAHATLLDGSPVMLRHARTRLSRFADRASFVEADLSTPDWVTGVASQTPLNAAVSCIAIHNVRDPRRVRGIYREIHGLLADGGVFLNLDYVRLSHPALRQLARWVVADAESGMLGALTARGGAQQTEGGRAHTHGGGGERGGEGMPGTVDEHLGWLREAGFTLAGCFFKDFGVALVGGIKGTPNIPEPPRK